MIVLKVVGGPYAGLEIRAERTPLRIGRGTSVDLDLKKDKSVSRLHGEIFQSGSKLRYRDLSKSGTVIESNGRKTVLGTLLPTWGLHSGDIIHVGRDSSLQIEFSSLPSQEKDPFDSEASEVSVLDSSVSQASRSVSNIHAFEQMLRMPELDLTDLKQVKTALCNSFMEEFPKMDRVVILGTKTPIGVGEKLSRGQLDLENSSFVSRNSPNQPFGYSFSILERAFKQKTGIYIKSVPPSTKSIAILDIKCCLCVPMIDGDSIIGFVQLFGTCHSDRDLEPGTVDRLFLLVGIASLIIRQTNALQFVLKAQKIIAMGQALAALSHDAKGILNSLGKSGNFLERDFPELVSSKKWQFLRQDLDFVRFLIKQTNIRTQDGKPPEKSLFELRDWVGNLLPAFDRYFINEIDRGKILLLNRCNAGVEAYSHANTLSIVLLNCVKNAIDAYLPVTDQTEYPIVVSVMDDPDRPADYILLNVADEARGIPTHILRRLGSEPVSTKGGGLGFTIIVETVAQLGGQVRVASSTQARSEVPAGTIVSLRLPKHENARGFDSRDVIVEDYENLFLKIQTGLPD